MNHDELIKKATRVINSCRTLEHASAAMRWLDLLSEQYPTLDGVDSLRKELVLFFELKAPQSISYIYDGAI